MMSDVDTSISQELQQCSARFLKVIRYLAANVQLAVFLKVHGIKIKGFTCLLWSCLPMLTCFCKFSEKTTLYSF